MIATVNAHEVGVSTAGGKLDLPGHISPTAAKSYLDCSLRFYFERVIRIHRKTPVSLHLGKAVHAALQAFHLARWRGGDDSSDAVASAFEQKFIQLEREEGPVNYRNAADRDKTRLDGLRVVSAYLDSPEAMKERPRAVEVKLEEDIPGLSVPLTGTMDLVEGNLTPVDFKSAASRPNAKSAAFDHEIQLVSYQLLLEAAIGAAPPSLDLVFLVKTRKPQVFRVKTPPADVSRKRRVVSMLETAVAGIAAERFHPQPGMSCGWCAYRKECLLWPAVEELERRTA